MASAMHSMNCTRSGSQLGRSTSKQLRCTKLSARTRPAVQRVLAAAKTVTAPVTSYGVASLQGTSRKQNEDRVDLKINEGSGEISVYAGVFDGHGGYATSDWLSKKLLEYITKYWKASRPEASITEAFLQADAQLLKPQGGFLGVGERGVGGSKCGSTAAVAVIYSAGSAQRLLTANLGDARTLIVSGGKAVQLSEDHVPDSEDERDRIEATNPNPRMPLVRFIGKTWRVGGLLALSRAFGDAYLKGSAQFEGMQSGSDGYSSGFGLVAEPYITVQDLTAEDSWIVMSSDGLFANDERGGGGGLTNDEVAAMCLSAGAQESCEALAEKLAKAAVAAGSTDDVTVVCMRLSIPAGART